MGSIGWAEMLVVAVIVLLIFGAKDLPKIGKSIGEMLKEFKKSMKDNEGK